MSALALTLSDSRTMLRRNLRRLERYPSMTLLLIGMPIVFLLLFVYVFGGQLGQGLGEEFAGGRSGRQAYLNYVVPGILLMTIAAAVQGTAIVVAMDMTGGITDRFRTMSIARGAVLGGHVMASMTRSSSASSSCSPPPSRSASALPLIPSTGSGQSASSDSSVSA